MAEPRSALVTIMAGVVYIIMAIPYAGIALLFAFQAFKPGQYIAIGGVVPPLGFGYGAMTLFLGLSALSAYAGLAATCRWRGWRLLLGLATCAAIGIVVVTAWIRLSGGLVGMPLITLAIVFAVALFGLLSMLIEREPG